MCPATILPQNDNEKLDEVKKLSHCCPIDHIEKYQILPQVFMIERFESN